MLPDAYKRSLSYADFLSRYGDAAQRQRWQSAYDGVALTDAQRIGVAGWVRQMKVLCIAGTWCGDCVWQCPHMQRIADANSLVELRFVDRDAEADLSKQWLICGGSRVPVVLFYSEDDHFCGMYGDRPLQYYRRKVEQTTGATCASGIPGVDGDAQAVTLAEWLAEFERIQWMLRTSPRLRNIHRD